MYDIQQFDAHSVLPERGVLVISPNEAGFVCVKRSTIQKHHVSSE